MKLQNLIHTLIGTVCIGLLPGIQAVVPAPDGGYPNFTTAEGTNALQSLTTGAANTAVGWFSLFSDITGSLNTSVGAGTLVLNTGDENTATGAGALLSNTTGTENTANGAFALFGNTEGSFDTAVGDRALFSNTTGIVNTAIGAGALASNTTGNHNTAIGGDFVLFSNTTGALNTATGVSALAANTTGNGNTAIGADALPNNITGAGNTAVGAFALSNTTGSENTAIGDEALVNNTTGGGNIVLGAFAGSGITTANNVICIGADGNNVDNSCYIGQIFGATSSGGTAVFINSNGRLGTATSSRRFKEEIKPMDRTSEALFELKPVAFRYKKDIDPAGTPQLGLVAEDVDKVNPDLVVRDKEGKPYSVRYDQVNAMLLNEFLKEHQTVQDLKSAAIKQETMIVGQQKQIEALTAGLQKVSAQLAAASVSRGGLEASKPPPQMVNNP